MTQSQLSLAAQFRALPEAEQRKRLATLKPAEILQLRHSWRWWARPDQVAPPGDWVYWLINAGRGFGKTRTGAEWVREKVRTCRFVNLIGATADDARDIMIDGESGILAICPKWERPEYKRHERRLVWPNGAVSLVFTAEEPERLRGKQHEALWADELGAWRYLDSWDQAQFGLRLGAHPQACITTTPRPVKVIKNLLADPACIVTHGSTYDNRDNLAPAFYRQIIQRYEGTRLGRQELNAELLEDNPNALWQRDGIDRDRVTQAPELLRVMVGVDPAATSNIQADETGVVIAGAAYVGDVEHFFVLGDWSLEQATPAQWGKRAVDAYHEFRADRIVGEENQGGEMVEHTIRTVDLNVSYKGVRATRGKTRRAEPIAALYEQGRVHHVGTFSKLEDQMCDWDPTIPDDKQKSPDRMDALVWVLTELSSHSEHGLFDFYAREFREQQERLNAERSTDAAGHRQ